MKFVRAIWKLLVGIKDALVLIFMLLFFGMLYGALSARPAPVRTASSTSTSTAAWSNSPRGRAGPRSRAATGRQYRLRDLVAALDKATHRQPGESGRARPRRLHRRRTDGDRRPCRRRRRVRSAGKPVIAYGVGYTNDSYQLASAASEIWLNPLGAVLITGPGGSNLYYKGLLDKLGVTANVYRVGTYKSAVEPFIRNDMSPAAKQNSWRSTRPSSRAGGTSVKKARPKANVDVFLSNMNGAVAAAGGDMAKAALAGGLVDRIGSRRAVRGAAGRARRQGRKERRRASRGSSSRSYVSDVVERNPKGPIGIVTIAGMIVDGKAGPGHRRRRHDRAGDRGRRRNDGIKALVVRVDSPGGSVLASERIRQALLEAKAKKIPIVVSMGSVAASGGYWVSTPADFIYAEPSTITGSIGVFGIIPSFQGTLKKLGIGADGVKTTPLSGEPDLLKGPSPEANQLIQAGVDSMYGRFLAIVAAGAAQDAAAGRRRSRRAACGTAAPRTSSGWSTASAGSTRRSPRRRSWPSSATSAASAISSRRRASASS